MNAKVARELLELSKKPGAIIMCDDPREFPGKFEYAKGYLECLEGEEVQELVDLLKRLEKDGPISISPAIQAALLKFYGKGK